MGSLKFKDIVLNNPGEKLQNPDNNQGVFFFDANGVKVAPTASGTAQFMEIYDLGRFDIADIKSVIGTRGRDLVRKSSVFDSSDVAQVALAPNAGTTLVTTDTILNVRFNIVATDPSPEYIRWDLEAGNLYREFQVVLQPGDVTWDGANDSPNDGTGTNARADAATFLSKLNDQLQSEYDKAPETALLIPDFDGTTLTITAGDQAVRWTIDVVDESNRPSPYVTTLVEDASSTEHDAGEGNYPQMRDQVRIQNPLMTHFFYNRKNENPIEGKLYSLFVFYTDIKQNDYSGPDADVLVSKEGGFNIYANEDQLGTGYVDYIANFLDQATSTQYIYKDGNAAANVAAFLVP